MGRRSSRPATRTTTLLWSLARPERRTLGIAVACSVVADIALIAVPWTVQRALDRGVVAGDGGALARWVGAAIALGVLATAFDRAGTGRNYLAGARAIVRLRTELLDAVLRLDRTGVARFGRGDLLSRNSRDADLLWAWIGGLVDTARLAVTVPVVLVAIAQLDVVLATVGLATVPLLVALAVVLPRRYEAASGQLAAAHGARGDVVEAVVAGSVAVRGLGGERPLVDAHHRASRRIADGSIAVARIGSWWGAGSELVPAVGLTIGLLVGGRAVIDGTLSAGGLVAFATWMGMLAARVALLVARQVARRDARVAVGRVADVLDRAPDADATATGDLPPSGRLVIAGLVVGGVDSRPRIGPMDLEVAPGERVAITGPTGSGKSTLLQALVGLVPVADGRVTFGGAATVDASPDEVRARLHLVSQRPVLLSGTVADNLRLAAPDASDPALWAALHVVDLDAEVAAMPNGLDTALGERGLGLSGGQAQRLALARGLLAGAPVLLLDNPTSAIDTPTEARVLRRLADAVAGRAVVVASHRPAVLATADRIVTLDGQGSDRSPGPART